jgi:hypothetical protein
MRCFVCSFVVIIVETYIFHMHKAEQGRWIKGGGSFFVLPEVVVVKVKVVLENGDPYTSCSKMNGDT